MRRSTLKNILVTALLVAVSVGFCAVPCFSFDMIGVKGELSKIVQSAQRAANLSTKDGIQTELDIMTNSISSVGKIIATQSPPIPEVGSDVNWSWRVGDHVGTNRIPIRMYSRDHLLYVPRWGREGNLSLQFMEVLELIGHKIAVEFPDRIAKKLEVPVACPPSGVEWPESFAHLSDGLRCDLHYYTWSKTNHTQNYPKGEEIVTIWDEENLLTNVFDVERNARLVQLLRLVFPQCKIIVDDIIKQRIAPNLNFVYGDIPHGHQHHDLHMDVHCGKTINLDVILQ